MPSRSIRQRSTGSAPALMLAALALLGAIIGAGGAVAQMPERRAVYVPDTDFFGGDLRSIFDTSLEACEATCLGDPECRGFTYNIPNAACFVKGAWSREEAYVGALSARVTETDPARARIAWRRAQALDFLDPADLGAAEALARGLGRGLARDTAAPDPRGRLAALASAANGTDAADDWLALAREARALRVAGALSGNLAGLDAGAAVNAALRAERDTVAAEALALLAATLEDDQRGRLAVRALALAEQLAPDPVRAEALTRVRALYGFRVIEHAVEAEAATPRLCVAFSEPLARAGIDYAPYLRTEGPGGPFAVEAEERRLCVEGVVHGARYRLAVRQGLPSAAGETIAQTVEIEAYLRDRSPSVRFIGRDHVLARRAGAAIPVVTVNLSEVALDLYRVGERSLVTTLRTGLFGSNLSDGGGQRLADRIGEALWSGTGVVEAPLNREVTTLLPLDEALAGAAPGLYVLRARVPDTAEPWQAQPTQWFVLTDLGLSAARGPGGLHVTARGLGDAAAKAGVAVQLLAVNNEVLGTATTDADGVGRFDAGLLRGRGGMEPALLVAEETLPEGADLAFLDLAAPALDLSDRGVEGRPAPPPIDVFVATDRGAYRPGETVYATMLARDAAAEALPGLPLTAIVLRPDGIEHARAVLADAGAGGRVFALPLDRSAMRGAWTLRVHADVEAPALATASVLVEEFEPERIDFDLALPEGPLDPAALPPLGVEAHFLWGAPGAGLALEGEARVVPQRTLEAHPGYRFGLADEPTEAAVEPLPGGIETDPAGRAQVPLLLPEAAPGTRPMALEAVVRLRDGSGRPVERRVERPLAPAAPLLGLRPLFDGTAEEGGTAEIDLLAIGPDLAARALDAAWTLDRIETRYQWYRVGSDWRWEPITRRSRVASGTVATAPGTPGRIAAGVDWGRYELRVEARGPRPATASLLFNAGWYAPPGLAETPDRLEVGLDRDAYAPGETARLRVVVPHAGTLIVDALTDGLVHRESREVAAGETTLEVPVAADWGAGAYLAATLLRPMDAEAGRNPARAMGIAWAAVDPGPRRLAARFDVAAEVRPRRPLEAVLEIPGIAPGETVHATVAATDLGILNLTAHPEPDPAGHYFGQRRLGVELRDLYGHLIDGLTGARGEVRSGGDAGLARSEATPPTGELVAFFSGPLTADAEGRVPVSFELPAFNGALRLAAVVWSETGVGQAATEVVVRDPVVVATSGPRFLAPGDRARLLVELDHVAGPAGPVRLEIAAAGPLRLATGPREVPLTEGGSAREAFEVEALGAGAGTVTLTATLPSGERLVSEYRLTVRANDPEIARQSRLALAPGGRLVLDDGAYAGLLAGSGRASLAAGGAARLDVPGLLAALDRYPYGCTEQVAARALPLLYLSEIARGSGLVEPAEIAPRVAAAIRAVLANQGHGGSFGLWRPDRGDLWLDAFASDFLVRARAAGHAVPETGLTAALDNLRNRVAYHGEFERGGEGLAYALNVLARVGRAAIGDLRYYADAKAEAFATPLALAQLGQALAFAGEQQRADALFRQAEARLWREGEPGWRVDFGSDLRDAAGLLALATEAGSRAVDLDSLVARIAADRPIGQRSTQENTWTLLAARALADAAATAGITVDGAPAGGPVLRLALPGDAAVVVENRGTEPVDTVLTVFGVPIEAPPAGGSGYRIAREWFTLEGERVAPDTVARGARLVAVVTVTPERPDGGRLIVSDPLPAGFEIDNPNLLAGGQTGELAWLAADDVATHTEFRTDRFVAAVDWREDGPFRLAYVLRAVTPGTYRHPAASVEDMYRPAFRARGETGRVTVTP